MALLLKHENLTAVRNPAFRQYAENCLAVYDDFTLLPSGKRSSGRRGKGCRPSA